MADIYDPSGTRRYSFDQATRTAFTSISTSAVAFGTLGGSREVMLTADQACFVALGTSSVSAADGTSASVLRIEAGEKFHLKLSSGVTHYRVIRDAADGVLRTVPVA